MAALRERVRPAADPESRVHDDHHESLRLWLRLLTCTLMIERSVRARLRDRFATTLPRFDLMAQLERNPGGLKMSELSRRMMVTGGSVTGITDQLATEGLVERRPIAGDRRAYAVRLTPAGRRAFDAMAKDHERWIEQILARFPRGERAKLYAALGVLKASLPRDGEPPRPRARSREEER
jgi:DNA-binding MarR family transcriptional regulator